MTIFPNQELLYFNLVDNVKFGYSVVNIQAKGFTITEFFCMYYNIKMQM